MNFALDINTTFGKSDAIYRPHLDDICRWSWLARRWTLPLVATQPARCGCLPATAAPLACGRLTGGSACGVPAPWPPCLIQVGMPDWSGELLNEVAVELWGLGPALEPHHRREAEARSCQPADGKVSNQCCVSSRWPDFQWMANLPACTPGLTLSKRLPALLSGLLTRMKSSQLACHVHAFDRLMTWAASQMTLLLGAVQVAGLPRILQCCCKWARPCWTPALPNL